MGRSFLFRATRLIGSFPPPGSIHRSREVTCGVPVPTAGRARSTVRTRRVNTGRAPGLRTTSSRRRNSGIRCWFQTGESESQRSTPVGAHSGSRSHMRRPLVSWSSLAGGLSACAGRAIRSWFAGGCLLWRAPPPARTPISMHGASDLTDSQPRCRYGAGAGAYQTLALLLARAHVVGAGPVCYCNCNRYLAGVHADVSVPLPHSTPQVASTSRRLDARAGKRTSYPPLHPSTKSRNSKRTLREPRRRRARHHSRPRSRFSLSRGVAQRSSARHAGRAPPCPPSQYVSSSPPPGLAKVREESPIGGGSGGMTASRPRASSKPALALSVSIHIH